MIDIPDSLVLRRHRDLRGRRNGVWARRSLLALVAAVPVAALFNVFGQRPHLEHVSGVAARLEVYAPSHVRGGLLVENRFTITARRELKRAVLVLGRGWTEGQTINSIEPSPLGEGSSDGRLALTLGHVPAGEKYTLYVQLQVNPTNVGRRSAGVWLYDGRTLIARLDRTLTVFP